jgi:hypothetical protein
MIRRIAPWILSAALAIVLAIVLLGKRESNTLNGVVQDSSGRRVVAWIDPMYSQGPPHVYKSNKPGVAPDCGMKLVPQYAGEVSDTGSNSSVSGYAKVSIPPARQQLIGVKLAKASCASVAGHSNGRPVASTSAGSCDSHKFEGFIDNLYVNFRAPRAPRPASFLHLRSGCARRSRADSRRAQSIAIWFDTG